jgi:hypothetical protein
MKTGKKSIKLVRYFSEEIRRQTVRDIEGGKCSVTEAGRELGVSEFTREAALSKKMSWLMKSLEPT